MWCHNATVQHYSGLVQQFKTGRRGEEGVGGGVLGFAVTFKFRGSGTGSYTAPAGNVTPSDVSGQAKYNLVSTWKDVL